VSFSFLEFQAPGPGGGSEYQTCTKTFLGQVGVCMQISSGLVLGFGFPLALHITTDKETFICTPIFIYTEDFLATQGQRLPGGSHLSLNPTPSDSQPDAITPRPRRLRSLNLTRKSLICVFFSDTMSIHL